MISDPDTFRQVVNRHYVDVRQLCRPLPLADDGTRGRHYEQRV